MHNEEKSQQLPSLSPTEITFKYKRNQTDSEESLKKETYKQTTLSNLTAMAK